MISHLSPQQQLSPTRIRSRSCVSSPSRTPPVPQGPISPRISATAIPEQLYTRDAAFSTSVTVDKIYGQKLFACIRPAFDDSICTNSDMKDSSASARMLMQQP